jgi:hypothetical protein
MFPSAWALAQIVAKRWRFSLGGPCLFWEDGDRMRSSRFDTHRDGAPSPEARPNGETGVVSDTMSDATL